MYNHGCRDEDMCNHGCRDDVKGEVRLQRNSGVRQEGRSGREERTDGRMLNVRYILR